MKNVTITPDKEMAARGRVWAAQRELRVSRMVGEMLKQKTGESVQYEEDMRRFASWRPTMLKAVDGRYATHEESHDRVGVR
jgi:hypothetical protein